MDIDSFAPKPGISRGAFNKRFNIDSLDRKPNLTSPKKESVLEIRRYKLKLMEAGSHKDRKFWKTAIRFHKTRLHT